MRRENFTHIGCGWLQIIVGKDKWALENLSGEYENFIVCNYAKSKNIQAASIECTNVVDGLTNTDSKYSNESGPPSVSSMSIDPETKEPEHLREGTKNPFLVDQRIDLTAISKSTLQEFVNFVLPHLDDLQEKTIIENLQSHGGIISVDNLENILLNMKIKPMKKLDTVRDETVQTKYNQEIENRSIFEDDISLKEHETCLRRYMERVNQTNISYYNSTTRTQVLTAICLEGIKCNPNEDDTKCLLLHKMCNQHINTSEYSFAMRVTLSECTLEDILCHLGHQTPVMCCQDKYSECVTQLNSDKVTLDGVEQTDSSFVIDSTDSSYDEAKLPITNEIIFSEDSPPFIIQNPGDFFAKSDQDEGTLKVFQNYTLVIDDSQELNSEIFREGNIQNIISGLNSNSTDYKIIFDPSSTVIGSNVDGQEKEISNILNIVNRAIQSTLNICSDRVCIENQDLSKASSPALEEKKEDEIEMRSRKQATAQKENQTLIEGKSHISFEDQLSSNDDINENIENPLTSGINQTNMDEKIHMKPNDKESLNQTSPPLEEENVLLSEQEDKQTHLLSSIKNNGNGYHVASKEEKNKKEEEKNDIPYMNQTSLSSNSEVFEDSQQPPEENKKNSVQTTINISYKEVPLQNIEEGNEVTTERGYSKVSTDVASVQYEASEKEESKNSEAQQSKDEFSILNIVREEGPNILADVFNVIKESVAKEIERKITAAKKAESSSISSVNLKLETNTEYKIESLPSIEKDLSKVRTRIPQNKGETLHQNPSVNELVEENSKLEHAREKPPKENEATETAANPDIIEEQEILDENTNLGNLASKDIESVEKIKGAVDNEQGSSHKGNEGHILTNQLTNQDNGPSNSKSEATEITANPDIIEEQEILGENTNLGNLESKNDESVQEIKGAVDNEQGSSQKGNEGQILTNQLTNQDNGPSNSMSETEINKDDYNNNIKATSVNLNPTIEIGSSILSGSSYEGKAKEKEEQNFNGKINETVFNFGINDAMDLKQEQESSQEGHINHSGKISNNPSGTGQHKIVLGTREEEYNNDRILSDSTKYSLGASTKPEASSDFLEENKNLNQILSKDNIGQTMINFGVKDAIDQAGREGVHKSSRGKISNNGATKQGETSTYKIVTDSREEESDNNSKTFPLNSTVDENDSIKSGTSTKTNSSSGFSEEEKIQDQFFSNYKDEQEVTNFGLQDSLENKPSVEQKGLNDETKLNNQQIGEAVAINDKKEEPSSEPLSSDLIDNTKKKISSILKPQLIVNSNTDIDIKQESEKMDSQKDAKFREKNKGVSEKAFESQREHENLNQKQNSISGERENQVVNYASNFKEDNDNRIHKPVYKSDTNNTTFDPAKPNSTWEEVKASTELDIIQNQDNNQVRKNQSSDSHMEMSLPSFGFNITFDQSKVKPILQENNNSVVFNAEKEKMITNEKFADVNTSKISDNTIIYDTLSKENMPILNERLNVSVEITPENEEKADEDLGATRKIVTKINIPRRSDDIVNIIKDIVYEQISDSESEEDLSSSQNQLFQNNKPYNNRKRMRNSLEQEIEVEEESELQNFGKGL